MPIDGFAVYHLARPLLEALAALSFSEPTEIQREAIPPQLAGLDVVAVSRTGSGKTAAFCLPLLHHVATRGGRAGPGFCRGLVLAPTRELAQQIAGVMGQLASGLSARSVLVTGGAPRRGQIAALGRGADVVVATPGRLVDLLATGALALSRTEILVLDEADQMLDFGFAPALDRVVAALPARRQTVMTSATMPAAVRDLASRLLRDPVWVSPDPAAGSMPAIAERVEIVDAAAKRARLAAILAEPALGRALVFTRRRETAQAIAAELGGRGLAAGYVHSARSQAERDCVFAAFRSGLVGVLVATDLAARGIDVPAIALVVNFDLPDTAEAYLHRIGRTGRNGAGGRAVTLATRRDLKRLRALGLDLDGRSSPEAGRAA